MARIGEGDVTGNTKGKLPMYVKAPAVKVPKLLARNYVTPDRKTVPDLLKRPAGPADNPWGLPEGGRLPQGSTQQTRALPTYQPRYEREDRAMMAQRAAQQAMNNVAYRIPYQDWTKYSPGVTASGTIGNTATNAIPPVGWEDQYLPKWNRPPKTATPTKPATDWRTRWNDVMNTTWPQYGPPAPDASPWVADTGSGGGGYDGYPYPGGGGYGGGGGGGGSQPSWMDMYQWRF